MPGNPPILSLSQLSRTRESFSDKFGHGNCVILRKSAIRRLSECG